MHDSGSRLRRPEAPWPSDAVSLSTIRLRSTSQESSRRSLAAQLRVAAGYRWRFHGRRRFDDRSSGGSVALIVIAGHKPDLWPYTLNRIARHVPPDIEVCLVTPGVEVPQLRQFATQHGWSCLSTENGHVSLAQNLAIRSLPAARYIFKLDEDIFVAEGFFDGLLRGYRQVQSEAEYSLGFCSPLLNVNGFSYVDYLRELDLTDAWRQRFGPLRRAMDGIPAQADGEAAVWLWRHGLPVDAMAAQFAGRPFGYSIVPHRFSIGAILFERELWEQMRGFRRGFRPPGLGEDEQHVAVSCLTSSRIMAVVHNVYAGHFAFGAQTPAMRAAFGTSLADF